ncbi:uncharacterized protein RHO25_011413 [Cercospora beticola]|uniref:C2H2-type domain-containing protein n=1 Tax=Cercospora beticola TaxID=122368 RepID=A0ABZ0P4J5_CERBT|nr:hypothetical protein RHO25_011413 [Cercospora beticola]CAK1366655.1 unnamed protein product [Cercospora beticola]
MANTNFHHNTIDDELSLGPRLSSSTVDSNLYIDFNEEDFLYPRSFGEPPSATLSADALEVSIPVLHSASDRSSRSAFQASSSMGPEYHGIGTVNAKSSMQPLPLPIPTPYGNYSAPAASATVTQALGVRLLPSTGDSTEHYHELVRPLPESRHQDICDTISSPTKNLRDKTREVTNTERAATVHLYRARGEKVANGLAAREDAISALPDKLSLVRGHGSHPRWANHYPIEYCCLIPNCTYAASRKTDLERHYRAMHPPPGPSAPLYDCLWQGCHRKGQYGFGRKDKMLDHMMDVHEAEVPKRDNNRESHALSATDNAGPFVVSQESIG